MRNLDRARRYSLEHADEAIKLFADGSHLDLDEAKSAFLRSDTAHPIVVPEDADGLVVWGKLFAPIGAIPEDTDIGEVMRNTRSVLYEGARRRPANANPRTDETTSPRRGPGTGAQAV